jgi:prepilin-type N-terminal cleavage/methylation domain-containing protein/prepilin-type processing-associated H-X9-DG protein
MRRKGFTLIELLVVIAIIALLLSVIMPALGKAKSQARILVCRTNAKALGTGVILYLEQNDQKMFPYVNSLWLLRIQDQLGEMDKIRYCPETVKTNEQRLADYIAGKVTGYANYDNESWIWEVTVSSVKYYEQGSYGMNGWLYGDVNTWVPDTLKTAVFTTMNDVKVPHKTPLFVDSYWVDSWPQNTNIFHPGFRLNKFIWAAGTSDYSMERFLPNRHKNERCNMVFFDGHAEMPLMTDLWTLTWHNKAKPSYDVRLPADADKP